MRAHHTAHSLPNFPIYSSAFVSPNKLVLGGGGGATKSGIKNRLRLYKVENEKLIELLDEYELDRDEDVPMSMAANAQTGEFVCGITSSKEQLAAGVNKNCRVFSTENDKLNLTRTQGTLSASNPEDYQKVTVISADGSVIAVAGEHELSLLVFSTLLPSSLPLNLGKSEIYDASFSATTLAIATTDLAYIFTLPDATAQKEKLATVSKNKKKGKGHQKVTALPELRLLNTLNCPTLPGVTGGSTFRVFRYNPKNTNVLYAVLNTTPPRTRTTKVPPRRAFLCKYNSETWVLEKVRKLGDKGVTCFDVSPDGKLLAYGSSDSTIGILDAKTLSPLLTVLKSHDFPPTTLRFNPTSNLLISGSADNTIRLLAVPEFRPQLWSPFFLIIIALLVVFLAFLAQYYVRQ